MYDLSFEFLQKKRAPYNGALLKLNKSAKQLFVKYYLFSNNRTFQTHSYIVYTVSLVI